MRRSRMVLATLAAAALAGAGCALEEPAELATTAQAVEDELDDELDDGGGTEPEPVDYLIADEPGTPAAPGGDPEDGGAAEAPGSETGQTAVDGRVPCSFGERLRARVHQLIHHPGATFHSCTVNHQTGWIYYTYSYPVPDLDDDPGGNSGQGPD